MNKSSSNSKRSTTQPPAVQDQIAQANQSGSKLIGTQTDILSPGYRFTSIRPSEDSMTIEDDNNQTHRVDTQHETLGQSHLSIRLEKFIQLTEKYSSSNTTEPAPPATSPADSPALKAPITRDTTEINPTPTFRAQTDWQTETPHSFVSKTVSPSKQVTVPANKPAKESSIGSRTVRIRIDPNRQQLQPPHFTVDNSPAEATPTIAHKDSTQPEQLKREQDGLLWKVNTLQWPAVTDQLLQDPSLTIDKIGNNVVKLMTGVQNQLMVTSAQRGEGVTTLAISIARWARGLNRQVLLVDADLERAELTQSIGLGRDVNWLSTINQPRNVGSTIVQDQHTGMFVMPLVPLTDRSNMPSNIYQELGKMLEPISDCFDLVIMDMGPSSQFLSETNRADLIADVGLLVKDATQSRSNEFSKAKTNLLSAGVAKMIVAENFAGNSVQR